MSFDDIPLILDVFAQAEERGFPIWLESGWAIDARLGQVTRPHDDVDIAFPSDRREPFESLLRQLGGGPTEETDYGFLMHVNEVLFDCEPCTQNAGVYELASAPTGSCPLAREGTLAGVELRCLSWEAILWEYLTYGQEVPRERWREKDHTGYALVCGALGSAAVAALRRQFESSVGP